MSQDCVHGGFEASHAARPLTEPLVQSTTYKWHGIDDRPTYSYAREGNPTVAALERRLAALEGGGAAVCFASGLAAIDALYRLVPDGGRLLIARHLYGGSTRLAKEVHGGRVHVEEFDSTDPAAVDEAFATPADLVLVETPSNPTLRITDLRHVIDAGHRAGALVAVDNTFLTPLWQEPLQLGADLSVHSTTKYLDGHDATLGGAIVVREGSDGPPEQHGDLAARLRWLRLATGAVLGPFEAWLTLQGCKTLHLRTRQQWASAKALAQAAVDHPAVQAVHHPGVPGHPGQHIHRQQATGDGGILALELGSLEAAARFVKALRVFQLAENLGATESLASSPALMTHAALGPEGRAKAGISDGLVRLSCGVEPTEDLVADVLAALDATVEVLA